MVAADDYIIPSIWNMVKDMQEIYPIKDDEYLTTDIMAQFTKKTGFKPTLISTGMKCQMDYDVYLQLAIRSSSPLKYWLMLANGVGIIDADYYNNPDNEGEIFFQVYNLSPFNIKVQKGEIIGQGVILPFDITDDDYTTGIRKGGFGSTTEEKK
jgi:dUTP pyrophosphatase